MLTRCRIGVTVAAFVALTTLSGCSSGSDFERPVLLVSGRDDHGLRVQATVDLLDEPDGVPLGRVSDGALVQVLEERSEWLLVRTLERERATEGWINDFHLRGQVHLVDDAHPACPVPLAGQPGGPAFAELRPSEQVTLLDLHVVDGITWVGVRTLQDPRIGLVPRTWVRELPVVVPPAEAACEDVHVDLDVAPHQH